MVVDAMTAVGYPWKSERENILCFCLLVPRFCQALQPQGCTTGLKRDGLLRLGQCWRKKALNDVYLRIGFWVTFQQIQELSATSV
jgi:hypothetical protein